jgi:hypothetical protein
MRDKPQGDEDREGEQRGDREAILMRRRRFVVTALAGAAVGLEACGKRPEEPDIQPQVCLKIAEPRMSDTPRPGPPPSSSGATAPSGSAPPDGEAPGAPDGGVPRVCLRVATPPRGK